MAALGAAAAPAAAVVLPVQQQEAAPAAAARPASTNWRRLRLKWAKALLLLACAAAALALFAMTNLGSCAPADAALPLRVASEHLLLAAAAQLVGATTAVLVPAPPVAVFVTLLGWQTGYRAPGVLLLLVACHGRVDVVLAIYYWILVIAMWVAFLIGAVISMVP